MSNLNNLPESVEVIKEPSSIMTLLVLAWTVVTIFKKWDPNLYIFVALMVVGAVISVMYQLKARKERNKIYYSPVYIYVMFFIGISAFSDNTVIFTLINIELRIIEGVTLLPLLLIWLFPMNTDNFFRLEEIPREERLRGTWKISLLIVYIIKFSPINQNFEFLVLIPMIAEPVMLYNENKGRMPLLTLKIQKEMFSKFAPQISLLKTVFFIQIAFISNFLYSKLWILLLMIFMTAIILSLIAMFAVQFSDENTDKIKEDEIIEIFNEYKEQSFMKTHNEIIKKENNEIVNIQNEVAEGKDIGSKAYNLGKRIRTEIKKPKYNLHNILSTLKYNSLQNGYRVQGPDFHFKSIQGRFNPPENLILFPVELGKFDYRRRGEILLLGFNKPMIKDSDDSFKKKNIKVKTITTVNGVEINSDADFKFNIGSDIIMFNDKTFNLQTLVVKQEEWEKMMNTLDKIDETYDLSYTGFSNLDELQNVLTDIGDKWNEVREKVKLTAANFIAGLFGVDDAIFLGVDDLLEQGDDLYLEEPKDTED